MIETESGANSPASVEEIQRGWQELNFRVSELEAERDALQQECKALKLLLERVIDHRQKSHSELVLLLTTLVNKLPLNDVGGILSKLVEHHAHVNQFLAALAKGTAEADMPQLSSLKTLEHTKQELAAALKPVVEELLGLDTPFESEMLKSLSTQPDVFFSPRMVRANRCFVKGQVPRERIVREFGEPALVFFQDMTTDPKLNPRPKPDEIVLAFKHDFESLVQQNAAFAGNKVPELLALYYRVQRSKAQTDGARAQKNAFHRLSFLIELLHYYENQNTEAADVIFAQRLPVLVEQLVLPGPSDSLDEKLIVPAEGLMAHVINPDHRQMVVNNIGKAGGIGKTLKFVLKLRAEKVPEQDLVIVDFVKHLIPLPPEKAQPAALVAVLRLVKPDMQRQVTKAIMAYDRLRKQDAEALGKAIGKDLGLTGLEEMVKGTEGLTPEMERQLAWTRIKEMVTRRNDPTAIAAAIRDRLNAKYDADELRQSWITLTEADVISLIRIFCQVPYRSDGRTDPIARTVIETYVTRLTHEKYAATYGKVVNSLRSMYHAKPDSPTLLNFTALVRWVSPEAANKLCADIGMPVAA